MFASLDLKKTALFALLGVVGCLVGWGLGEGFLAVAGPKPAGNAPAEPSLASKPKAPVATTRTVAQTVAAPTIEARGNAAPPPPPEFRARQELYGAQTGDIQITLIWDSTTDLDLICVDPNQEMIYFDKPKSSSGGFLDVDKNRDCQGTTQQPLENIFWPKGKAPSGKYAIGVLHYKTCDDPPLTKYKVNVLHGNRRQEFSGSITHEEPLRPKVIGDFTYDPKDQLDLQFAVSPSAEVVSGGKNRVAAKIVRTGFKGPVSLKLEGEAKGLKIHPTAIPEASDSAEFEIEATGDAPVGQQPLQFVAEGSGVSARATTTVTVVEAPKSVMVAAAETMQLDAGSRRNVLPVAIARDGFDGPVVVRLEGEAEGVAATEITIAAGDTEGELELNVGDDAPARSRSLRVVAAAAEFTGTSAATAVEVAVVARPPTKFPWRLILILGLWTGLLAFCLSAALVIGQNRYLSRPWINAREALILLVGGVAAGLVGGGIGQAAYALLFTANWGVPAEIGFLLGWLILGGLVGRGLGFFVPNLKPSMAVLAGAVGGALGAGAFLGVSALGDLAGRAAGAAILGGCIGLVIALVEAAFRDAWLEVAYGPREKRTVNLGPEPVKVGSSSHGCAVWTPGVEPVVLRFWIAAGKVLREQVPTKQTSEVSAGHRERVGGLEIVVRKGVSATAGAPQPTRTPPPPPPSKILPIPARPSSASSTASIPSPPPAARPLPPSSDSTETIYTPTLGSPPSSPAPHSPSARPSSPPPPPRRNPPPPPPPARR